MSGVFGAVIERLAAGSTPRAAAAALGISVDLAESVADEAERMGLVMRAGAACVTCAPSPVRLTVTPVGVGAPARPVGCAGCPMARGA